MYRTLTRIFIKPGYLVLALLVAFLVLSVLIFVPNRMLLYFGLGNGGGGLAAELSFIFSFYGSLLTNFTPLAAVIAVVTSLLVGLNIALLTLYVRQMRGSGQTAFVVSSLSLSGLVSAGLGIGCAVCGSIVATSFLSIVGATGLVLWLPFGGEEFSFLAIMLLLYATSVLLRKIEAGRVC